MSQSPGLFPYGDTPVDSGRPYHIFSTRHKVWMVTLVSISATFSPLSSNIYFPVLDAIADSLNINAQTVNLSITTYMIAQGLTPSLWSPVADICGRRQTLIYTLALYIGANVGLALSQDGIMLLVFRFLQAAGSSSTISIGAGIISDFAEPSERGAYLGYFSGARQFSLAIGPVLGGLLGGTLGFRSIFWFLFIFSSAVTVLIILCLPETMRRIAGDGSVPLKSWAHRPLIDMLRTKKKGGTNEGEKALESLQDGGGLPVPRITFRTFYQPLGLLFEKDVACALFYGATVYTSWSMVTASTTPIFLREYQLPTIIIGVCFLANGVGCILGSVMSGRSLNENFRKEGALWQQAAADVRKSATLPKDPIPIDFRLEKARLGDAPVYTAVCIFSCLVFGWSVTPLYGATHVSVSLLVPLLAQFAIGFSATAVLNSNNTLIVDLFPGQSASATAVNNLVRCSMGAVGVGIVDIILDSVGAGWLGVIMAGLVALGYVCVALESWKGKEWRAERLKSNASTGCTSPA